MKYCSKCGAEIMDEAVVCPQCGCAQTSAPKIQLPTERNLGFWILFNLLTFGIYGLVVMTRMGGEINIVASKYDSKRTMNFCLVAFLFSWLTFGIVPLVWYHRFSARIGDELKRRGIAYEFGAGTFWGWSILGALIFVGPFIYIHKLLTSMNKINESYNEIG